MDLDARRKVVEEGREAVPAGDLEGDQGRFVEAPRRPERRLEPADNVFVMNSNYLDEIRSQSGNAYTYITVDHG